MPLDKWQKVVDVNLTGAFLFAQAAGRDMLERGVGPHHQHRVDRRPAGVGATVRTTRRTRRRKAGLMGLTRELAASWGRKGIRVNAIAPGLLPFASRRRGDRDGRAGNQGVQPDSARRRSRAN